jgi:DNA (cytosine-5)-methyltransferase 1
MPARTTRQADLVVTLPFDPFIASLRGGGDRNAARPVAAPLGAFTAGGQHHLLATPDVGLAGFVMRNNTARGNPAQMCSPLDEQLRTLTTAGHQSLVLVPFYRTGVARPVTEPVGTFTTRDRYALAQGPAGVDLDDVLVRMLTVDEIRAGMAFPAGYRALGSQKTQVSLYGRAVTPPAAEVIGAALVEAIVGHDLPPSTPDGARPEDGEHR